MEAGDIWDRVSLAKPRGSRQVSRLARSLRHRTESDPLSLAVRKGILAALRRAGIGRDREELLGD
jgi:hypothetical protein